MTHEKLVSLIASEGLPSDFIRTVKRWYTPLADNVARCHQGSPLLIGHQGSPLLIGVQGSQGSGKSTLAQFLKLILEQDHQLRCVALSLDDFYLTLAERKQLAELVHPLFITRGVPGTHDVSLAIDTLDTLMSTSQSQTCSIPRFNKAIDDRHPKSDWDNIATPVDIVIFEGWCVGADAQTEEDLAPPINELERSEDPYGAWRTYSNQKLRYDYAELFSRLDKLIVLAAPSFECVYDWRWLQEQKLVRQWQTEHPNTEARLLDENSVRRFISHYERLTRHCLSELHRKADWLLALDDQHNITNLVARKND
ncbi:MAG: D-glycerate 3-kinase [Flavobacteriales bacterium]|jgi:D-glycerate 3-kinase